MIEFRYTVHAPPLAVFAVLTDVGRRSAILPGVISAKFTDGLPLAAGTGFEETRRSFGRARIRRCRITAYEPPLHLSVQSGRKEHGLLTLWTLRAETGATRVTVRLFAERGGLRGWIPCAGRLYEWFAARQARADMAHYAIAAQKRATPFSGQPWGENTGR